MRFRTAVVLGFVLVVVCVFIFGGIWYDRIESVPIAKNDLASNNSPGFPVKSLSVPQQNQSSNNVSGISSPQIALSRDDVPESVVFKAGISDPEWLSLTTNQDVSSRVVEPVISDTANGYHVAIDIPGFFRKCLVHEKVEYDAVDIPGFAYPLQNGQPSVPIKNILLPIPDGVQPEIQITALSQQQIGNIHLWPGQPLPMDASVCFPESPFKRNAEIYTADAFFPESPVFETKTAHMRNKRILTVSVAPLQVNPVQESAVIADHLEFDIYFVPPADSLVSGSERSTCEYLPEGMSNGIPAKYMILLDDQFSSNTTLAAFVEWKRRKGYHVGLVSTSHINTNGAPINEEIISFLRGLSADEYPEYLLILGDHTASNGIQATSFSTYNGGWSDLYIACRDDADFIPDLYYGRLPARNNRELDLMLGKALAMDRMPPTNTIFQRLCIAGQIQDCQDAYFNEADRLFCETIDSIACYFEQDSGETDYACERAVVNPNNVTAECYWNRNHLPSSILWSNGDVIGQRVYDHFVSVAEARTRISGQINKGIVLLLHRDHGSVAGWGDPFFVNTDVSALTNGNNRPAVFSINCLTGSYHADNNFTRAWLQHTNGGAYAVFSPTDVSYSWLNDWLTHGFCAAFLPDYISTHNASTSPDWSRDLPMPGGTYGSCGSARRLGKILNFGKMYMAEHFETDETTFQLFHLFGDPEAFLQLKTPRTLMVDHLDNIGVGPCNFVVNAGEADVQIGLYSETLGIHQVRLTSANGQAVFPVCPPDTGVIHVTAVKAGCRPVEHDVEVSGSVINFSQLNYHVLENAETVSIPILRSGDTTLTARIEYQSIPLSADAGIDYSSASGFLSYFPGETQHNISIPILNDESDERFEEFAVHISIISTNTVFGMISNATVSIEDDDGAGEFRMQVPVIVTNEAAGQCAIRVVRQNGTHGSVAVTCSTFDGTATHEQDYTYTNTRLTFPGGMRTNQFYVPVTQDVNDENSEYFNVFLSDPAGGVTLHPQTNCVVEIIDDDSAGYLSIADDQPVAYETNYLAVIRITRSGGCDGPVTCDFGTRDGSALADFDYIPTNGTVVLDHHCNFADVYVQLVDDIDDEKDETFYFAISNATGGALLCDPVDAAVTIVSDEHPRTMLPYRESFETGTLADCWNTRSDPAGKIQVSTSYGPADGSHHLIMDSQNRYALNEAVLHVNLAEEESTFLKFYHKSFKDDGHAMPEYFVGHTNADGVAVSTNGIQWYKIQGLITCDGISENYQQFIIPLDEQFARHGIEFSDRVQIKFQQYDDCAIYQAADGFAFDLIELRRQYGELQFADKVFSGSEGTVLDIAVNRVNGHSHEIAVDYLVSNQTAVSGSDFVLASGTLRFPDGVTNQMITVPLADDGVSEGEESFSVILSAPSECAYLGNIATAVVYIADTDDPGYFQFDSVKRTCAETTDVCRVSVIRKNGTHGTATLHYATTDITAIAGEDYLATNGILSYAPGVTSQTINITILNDAIIEKNESFLLALANPSFPARLGSISNCSISIVSDETPAVTIPFFEDFESGILSNYWSVYSATTNAFAKITSLYTPFEGTKHFVMGLDYVLITSGHLNELLLQVSMPDTQNANLTFYHKTLNDENHVMPDVFYGHHNSDGVAISDDGFNWYKLQGLTSSNNVSPEYKMFSVDMEPVMQQHGLCRDQHIWIKFQQYDDSSLCLQDGFAFDNIALSGEKVHTLQVVPAAFPIFETREGKMCSPSTFSCSLSNTGSTPLAWTLEFTNDLIASSARAGNIAAESSVNVTFTFSSGITNLLPGEYEINLAFNTTNTLFDHPRHILLRVTDVQQLPAEPHSPLPANFAHEVDLNADIAWSTAASQDAGTFYGAVQILAFLPFASTNSGGQYDNMICAITEHYSDFYLSETTTQNPDELAVRLEGKDVLLMPPQSSWSLNGLSSFGVAVSNVLHQFVRGGGRIVICDGAPQNGYAGFLRESGLMQVSNAIRIYYNTGSVCVQNDITAHIATNYPLAHNAFCYSLTHDAEVLVERKSTGAPVVLRKTIGEGDIILIGHDYQNSNTNQTRLLANCINCRNEKIHCQVFFGTNNPPVTLIDSSNTTYLCELPRLSGGSTCYWQIVANNSVGSVTGPVWQFITRYTEQNLLKNGSFEWSGDTPKQALHWENSSPDSVGGTWGAAVRCDVCHYPDYSSDCFCAGIYGNTSVQTNAGWWQDVSCAADRQPYCLSGWFRVDAAWTSRFQQLEMEFIGSDGQRLTNAAYRINELTGCWQYRRLEALAPSDTFRIRCMVYADAIGTNGTLFIDDLQLVCITNNADTLYVSQGGNHIYPYADWSMAATNPASAICIARDGNTVVMDDGIYPLEHSIPVNRNITVKSRNGYTDTIIHGQNVTRCFQLNAPEAVLDGLTITDGRASGEWPDDSGAGVFLNRAGSVCNCRFSGNVSEANGGAAGVFYHGTFSNCIFTGNTASNNGGAVYLYYGGDVTHCIITSNQARNGGGIYNQAASSLIAYSRIAANQAFAVGGGVAFANVTLDTLLHAVVDTCCFYENEGTYGGAVGCSAINIKMNNSTITQNLSSNYAGGIALFGGSVPTIRNSIIWNNPPASLNTEDADISGSCIQNGCPGMFNITNDPQIVSSTCCLQGNSPCIDAGMTGVVNSVDIRGVPRPLDGDDNASPVIDMGAFEYIHALADTDDDGLPDQNEIDTGVTSPLNPDCDNDGQSDGDEDIAGTDPVNRAQIFKTSSSVTLSNVLSLSWQSSVDRLYTVQKRMSLFSAWTNCADAVNVTGTGHRITYPVHPESIEYYRVKVRKQ